MEDLKLLRLLKSEEELQLIDSIECKLQFREEVYLSEYSEESLNFLKEQGVINKIYGIDDNLYKLSLERLKVIYNRVNAHTLFYVARKYVSDTIRTELSLKYFKEIMGDELFLDSMSAKYFTLFGEYLTVGDMLKILTKSINEDVLLVDFFVRYITEFKNEGNPNPTDLDYMIDKLVFTVKNFKNLKEIANEVLEQYS